MKPVSLIVALSIVSATGAGCVSIPDEAERNAALRAEPLSANYRVALLSTGLMPIFLSEDELVAQLGEDVGEGFARRLPASVEDWGEPYSVPIIGEANILQTSQINEYSRAQHADLASEGYNAVLTVTLQLMAASESTGEDRQDGIPLRSVVQAQNVQSYISLRSIPEDKLLYFDTGVVEPCHVTYFQSETTDSVDAVFEDHLDDESTEWQLFVAELSACVSRLSSKLLVNFEATSGR